MSSYHWDCLKHAGKGAFDRANTWAPLLGAGVLYGVLWMAGYEMILPDNIPGTILVALACIGLAYILIVFFRFLVTSPIALYRTLHERIEELEQELARLKRSPLEIFFDPANPQRRFWSFNRWLIPQTDTLESGVEYRVEIRNISTETAYDVRVTVENRGETTSLPGDAKFISNGTQTCDIHPGASEFVKVFLAPPNPNQPGTLSGPSSESYGPVVIRASARDVAATSRTFKLDPFKEPVIFD